MPTLRDQIPKDPSTATVATEPPPDPLVLAHKRAALYRICCGKFQSRNVAFLAAEKYAGLTRGNLIRHQAKYYYKGYPDNDVTAKVAAQQLGLGD